MSRNIESRFSKLPEVEISRSRFDRSSTHKTTFNAGKLIPIYVDEVLPGDTFSMDVASLVRMSTPIFPVMDNAYLDTYFFFVPNRLVWDHWKEFNGENTSSYWTQPVEYQIPQLIASSNTPDSESISDGYVGWNKGSLADYFGIPTNVEGISVNALPFRAYCLIWNEWFRDQNTMSPAQVYKDDTDRLGMQADNSGFENARLYAHLGSDPLPVCKYHDYFTSCLPAPQKGPAVNIPFTGDFPVVPLNKDVEYDWNQMGNSDSLEFVVSGGNKPTGDIVMSSGNLGIDTLNNTHTSIDALYPSNLFAVSDGATITSTINSLRQAFQIQKLFERDARGGTRYTEILKSHFGVDSPDARLQRPEYLGGKRIPINVDQVLQTSETTSNSPQGNTAAYSLTVDTDSAFTKSFTEHGYIIGLCCVRTDHTYQQGIDRMWSRKRRFDFYWPSLANIGEQAVLKKEIFAVSPPMAGDIGNGMTDMNEEAFGYQEAWAEYRYKPSRVSSSFRSNYSRTLDSWHYADYYGPVSEENVPVLQANWLIENDVNIDRTLAVSSDVEDQFIADFYFKCDCVRPMPLYSIPGLIDHH